jgi:cell division protein FtsI/penicillin-binding protein 2
MKKGISILMILLMLFGAALPAGCASARGKGSDVCLAFIEYIAEGSYGAAFDMLSDSVKNTSGTSTKAGDPMISAKEFAEKYQQIFDAVGLKEISYLVKTVSDASITSSVDFQMTYDTALGEMVNDYTINALYENGRWGIQWTPALIFPTMEWGDKLLVGVNYPKRGEIFDCNGELLVKNLSPVTVFCVPNQIPEDQKEEVLKQILAIPILKPSGTPQDEYEEIVHDAIYSKNSSAVIAKLYPDQVDETLEDRLLSITGIGIDRNGAMTSTRFRAYPYGRSASHLLGFAAVMWKATWKDLEKLRNARDAKNAEAEPDATVEPSAEPEETADPSAEPEETADPSAEPDASADPSAEPDASADPTAESEEQADADETKTDDKKKRDEEYSGYKFTEADLDAYEKDSWLGYAGLEQQYETLLRGEKGGYAYIQGLDGTNRQTLYNNPAKDGQDLHLTLDIKMQQRVEEVVKTVVYTDNISGTVIVMNPHSGAIQAMYSFPDYDVEAFSRGAVGTEAYEALTKDPQTPMLNRAIQGLYAPGSTFKPFTGVGSLEAGTVTPDTLFPEEEMQHIHNARYKTSSGWKDVWEVKRGTYAYTGIDEITRTGSSNRHTPMNMESSIIDSDNIFFAWLALKLGWDRFKEYLSFIGMGETVPFDIPAMPSQIKNEKSTETYSLLAMSGYGQGELLVTPLQMACYIAAFRNGGKAPVPHVVESIWQAEGQNYTETYRHTENEVWKTICSEKNAETMANMMIGVCKLPQDHGGTGRYLGVRSFIISGKTGTAEIGNKKDKNEQAAKEIAWFIGFRKANKDGSEVKPEDERLVLVMLELDMQNLPEEYSLMKFVIARVLLKDDDLTKPGKTNLAFLSSTGSGE